MNIKFVSGFMAGIIMVFFVWYFFPDIRKTFVSDKASFTTVSSTETEEKRQEVKSKKQLPVKGDDVKKNDTVEKEQASAQNVVDNQMELKDSPAGDVDDKTDMIKTIQEQNRVSWAEVDRSITEVEGDPAEKDVLPENQTEIALDESAIKDHAHTSGMDIHINNSDTNPMDNTVTVSDEGTKFLFWKPFFLESKAKKFAAYLTSISKVDCLVDKNKEGNYQVYYLYQDEEDKLAKAEMIKSTGITF